MTMADEEVIEPEVDEEIEESTESGEQATEEEYVAPTKEEYARIQRALKRARADAKKARESATSDASAKDEAKQASEALASWQRRAVTSEAKTLLVAAGAKADNVTRLVRLLDYSGIDLGGSDDDIADALNDQIEDIKGDFSELFGSGAPVARRPGPVDQGAANGKPVNRPKTFREQLFERGYQAAGKRPPKLTS